MLKLLNIPAQTCAGQERNFIMEIFKNRIFALKGIIVHTPDFDHMEYHENEYVICKDGKSAGIFHELPEEYQEIPVESGETKFSTRFSY